MLNRIEKIDVFCLQDPQADFVRFEGSYQNVVVVVTADNGMYGIGESDSPPQMIKALIEAPSYNHLSQGLASLLIGETLDDPKRLWQKMYKGSYWHGRNGAVIHAISALDIAIWDLFSQINKAPLHHYFGELKHTKLPAYATIYPLADTEAGIKAQIMPLLESGMKRIKICVEPWWSDFDKTLSNLNYLRHLVSRDIELMLDVALEFDSLAQLKPFLSTLEALDFKWIEAPFNLENLADHIALKQLTHIPIGVGDLGMTTCKEFLPYLNEEAFDIAQPDITLFGGISEVIKLRDLISKHNKRIVPHAYNTDITIAVNSHFLSTQIKQEALEYSTSPSLLRQRLIENPYSIDQDGMVTIEAEQDGLGIKLNWDIIRSCTIR